jgi:hypothetical protein
MEFWIDDMTFFSLKPRNMKVNNSLPAARFAKRKVSSAAEKEKKSKPSVSRNTTLLTIAEIF